MRQGRGKIVVVIGSVAEVGVRRLCHLEAGPPSKKVGKIRVRNARLWILSDAVPD